MKLTNPALIICDLQIDLCAPSGFAGKLGRDLKPMQAILPNLKRFYQFCRKAAIPIYFTQYIARKDLSPVNVKINIDRQERARLCLLNSQGAKLYFLKPTSTDKLIQKRFFDAFAGTELKTVLKKQNVKTLIITGVRSELGVEATAKRAVAEGYTVIMVSDLIGTYGENQRFEQNLLKLFDRYYGYVFPTAKIKEMIEDQLFL
jgi:nicotinamidase-related amidase